MRYCPYCGAVLSDNVVSFCLNCKKEVVGERETVEKQKTRKNKQRKRQDKTQPIVGVGYGEYYEDIVPEDADRLKETKSKDNLGIKIGLLSFGVILVVAACVVVMLLL